MPTPITLPPFPDAFRDLIRFHLIEAWASDNANGTVDLEWDDDRNLKVTFFDPADAGLFILTGNDQTGL